MLGFDTLDEYVMGRNPSFGSVPGRVANRIANGTFTLGESTFELEKNNGENHLHGGSEGKAITMSSNVQLVTPKL